MMVWGQVITLVAVFASWYFVPLFSEHRRKETELGLWQHTAMSNAHRNLAAAFQGLHAYTTKLASQYNCNVKDVLDKMSTEEIATANDFVLQMNTELAIIYMIMPDDKYKTIYDTIEPGQSLNLIEQSKKLLVAMRQSQFPDTKYNEPENIRSFDALKKP